MPLFRVAPRRPPYGVHCRVYFREDAARVLQERLAGGQQAHAVWCAFEQPGAELIFEREDVAAERRLGEVEPARGTPHMALFGHRDKGLDVREAHGPAG